MAAGMQAPAKTSRGRRTDALHGQSGKVAPPTRCVAVSAELEVAGAIAEQLIDAEDESCAAGIDYKTQMAAERLRTGR